MSLNNLSPGLADLGRREEALAAIEEAADIYRELAAARPDAFRPDLAMSLNNLSTGWPTWAAGGGAGRDRGSRRHLPGAGRGPPGRVPARPGRVAEQPVGPAGATWAGGRRRWPHRGSRRHLPGAGRGPPGRVPARPGQSLNNLSVRLAGLGRREDALAAIEEAAGIYRELAAARPDAFRPDLAMSLNNLSVRLGGLGRREEALAAIQEAVTIRRELAARWPDAYHQELEQSLQVVAWLEHGEDLSDASRREPKK